MSRPACVWERGLCAASVSELSGDVLAGNLPPCFSSLCCWSEKGRQERREHGGGVGEPAERMMVGDKCWGEMWGGEWWAGGREREREDHRERWREIPMPRGYTHTQLHIQSSTRWITMNERRGSVWFDCLRLFGYFSLQLSLVCGCQLDSQPVDPGVKNSDMWLNSD